MTTFEQTLTSLLIFSLSAVSALIQQRLKDNGFNPIDQRWIAFALSTLVATAAIGLQFIAGIPIFTDLTEPYDAIRIVMTVLTAYAGSQATYNTFIRKKNT